MKLKLQPVTGRSKRQRFKESLVGELVAGRLTHGDWLPSEQILAAAAGLARNTVRRSLAELELEGHVRRIPGRGTVVHDQAKPTMAAKQSVGVFALVVPEDRGGYYPTLLSEFGKAAGELHQQVAVCNSENDVHRQADIILRLIDSRAAGVAIVPATNPATPPYHIRQLQERDIPVVFCHRAVAGVQAPLLEISADEVGHMAGRALLDHGHRHVVYFASHRGVLPGYVRGLREILLQGGADLPEDCVIFGSCTVPSPAINENELREQLTELCSRPDRPTAIMASFDSLAEMIYLQLGVLGVRIPQDMSIISFGGAWREGALGRRLSAVTLDEAITARRAIELLTEMRSGRRPLDSNERWQIALEYYPGETLGPAPKKAKPFS